MAYPPWYRSGERLDQPAIFKVRGRTSPGEAGDLIPGPLGVPTVMSDSIGRVDQARPMMARDTVEKDRLQPWIGQKVGRLGHLLGRGPRASHRDEDPADARLADNSRLVDILRVVLVDRGEADDRPDPLAGNDPSQRPRPLPRPPDQPARLDDHDPLFKQVVPKPPDQPGGDRHACQDHHAAGSSPEGIERQPHVPTPGDTDRTTAAGDSSRFASGDKTKRRM